MISKVSMLVVMLLVTASALAIAIKPPSTIDVAPGAIDPRVTQENLATTICQSGWSKSVRPPVSFTAPIKRKLMEQSNATDPHAFELDHKVPISSGGCPDCLTNLWLQPWSQPEHHHCSPELGMDAACKDRLENFVHRQICTGQMTLAQGQSIFLGDWIAAYHARFQ